MNQTPRDTTLRDYLRVLRERWIMIVVITLAFAGAALAYSAVKTPTYEASASLSFKDPTKDLDLLGTPVAPAQTSQQLAATSVDSVKQPEVAARVRQALRTKTSAGDLLDSVDAHVDTASSLVVVTAQSHNRRFAARLANEFAAQTAALLTRRDRGRVEAAARELRRKLKSSKSSGPSGLDASTRTAYAERVARLDALARLTHPVDIVKPASVPESPASPKPVLYTAFGAALGLLLGVLAAFVRSSLDRRLQDVHDIEQLQLPVIGHVGENAMGAALRTGNGQQRLSAADLESFRILRQKLDFLNVDDPPRSVIVTSPLPEEGKSTVAASLAMAAAMAGKSTLLLECDLRRPALAQRLGLARAPGLAEYLAGHASPEQVVQPVRLPAAGPNGSASESNRPAAVASLACITAGAPPPRPAELLGSNRMRETLAETGHAYDLIVLDTSPLLPVVDTLELLPHVDALLMCVRVSQTTRDQAAAAKAALDDFPGLATGVVVTGLHPKHGAYYGYYGYAHAYGAATR